MHVECMKTEVQDYFGVAVNQARRWYPFFLLACRDDVMQECHEIALIGARANANLKEFSRQAQRHLYAAAKAYGFYRHKQKGFVLRAPYRLHDEGEANGHVFSSE